MAKIAKCDAAAADRTATMIALLAKRSQAMTDIDDKLAFEMFRLRVAGQSERKIATKYKVATAAVRERDARMLPAVDTAMRVQVHALELNSDTMSCMKLILRMLPLAAIKGLRHCV